MVEVKATAYFDESGSHDDSPILCLAGFVINRESDDRLCEEWQKMLGDFGLPFFHMSDCAHGTRPFDVLSKDDRIKAATRAIALIRESISYGFAVTVNKREFAYIVPKSPHIGSAYSLCVHAILSSVRTWADTIGFQGTISYVFEQGHRSQREANGIMAKIFKSPKLRSEYRYAANSFEDKRAVASLQAADIIAWQWFTENKRRLNPVRAPRKDFEELMIKPMDSGAAYYAKHLSENLLRGISNPILQDKYPLTFPGNT